MLARRRRIAIASFAVLWCWQAAEARPVDILAYFHAATAAGRDGLARKTRTVDARLAKPGEVIVTVIKSEGKETQSPPAKDGDIGRAQSLPVDGERTIPRRRFRVPQAL